VPNLLAISVENADEILNTGAYAAGALIRVQWSATEAGAFADVSGTGSTPTLAVVTGVRSYTAYDPNGTASLWYRTRYENAAATRVSDWSAAFQTGDETAGLLCSWYDVWQRTNGSATIGDSDKENLLEVIRGVSSEIEDYVGAWLAPRPTNATSTATYRFDVDHATRRLWLGRGGRYVGIRSVTAINLATTSQPETGGTYTAGTLADVLIRPQPTADGPGWRLEMTDLPTGGFSWFCGGYNTVEVTGTFGPAAVAGWCQEIAIAAATRRFLGKETAATAIGLGPEGGVRLLGGLPPEMIQTLTRHRFEPVA
jgi:hypothetical protein